MREGYACQAGTPPLISRDEDWIGTTCQKQFMFVVVLENENVKQEDNLVLESSANIWN